MAAGPSGKVLVVFYSRTGNTRKVAEAIAAALRCEVEEIRDTRDRRSRWGYVRSALDALLRRTTTLAEPTRRPSDYDLVIVGTPVWVGSVSTPVRTYLARHRGAFRRVAFFLTQGGAGAERVFAQMEELTGLRPVGALALREAELFGPAWARGAADFATGLVGGSAAEPVR